MTSQKIAIGLREAADMGISRAQYNLGVTYSEGLVVTQDYAEAVRWFHKAADQGYAAAQHILGTMYYFGKGVPQTYAEAMKWYLMAADQDDAIAQKNLGNMYLKGLGVPQDFVQAHMWYNLAAAQGQKDTGDLRDSLAEQMTPAQIAEAQKLAREWKPKGK